MVVTWEDINRHKPTNALCVRGTERKVQRLVEEEYQARSETAFRLYGQPLNMVMSFHYLVRIFTEMDDDWPEVIGNLQKWRRICSCLSKILGKVSAYVQTSGCLYLDIVHTILVFVSDTWVVNPRIRRVLGGVYHCTKQKIMGKQPRK